MQHAEDIALTRLATYGTLALGRVNHHQLSDLTGEWHQGMVKRWLIEAGWGAALGYPGLVLDPKADDVAVHVFSSPDLPQHWQRLDGFEGPGYRRVVTEVMTDKGIVEASIYVIDG